MSEEQMSLNQLGRIMIALHRRGYKPGAGYSFAERDDQFGEGSVYVCAVCIPPEARREQDEADKAARRHGRRDAKLMVWATVVIMAMVVTLLAAIFLATNPK